jgi:hypothetical protein
VYGRRNLVNTQILAPFKIVNLGVNGSAFLYDGFGGSVLTHIGDTDHGEYGLV